MKHIVTLFLLMAASTISAQSQYEQGMQKAFGLWGEGKSTEAAAVFERIAAAEKTNWLPYYYVALVTTTDAFMTQDKDRIKALLAKAQEALDSATLLSQDNAELLVMEALIQIAWIVYDPMTNGAKLSPKVKGIYAKARKLAPDNPRVVFSQAEFDMGGAAYFNQDTTPMCQQIEKAITLFATFKPETAFHPNWGLDRAQEAVKQCNKK